MNGLCPCVCCISFVCISLSNSNALSVFDFLCFGVMVGFWVNRAPSTSLACLLPAGGGGRRKPKADPEDFGTSAPGGGKYKADGLVTGGGASFGGK